MRRVEGAGDSIMQGYNASCSSNTGLFDFLCYGGGEQPANSFLDGSSTAVTSIVDRYIQLDSQVTGGKAASASGSEMTDATKNNFATQASAIVSAATQPTRVFVELGGNDICNRATVNDLYTDAVWETAVRTGLETLVTGCPMVRRSCWSACPAYRTCGRRASRSRQRPAVSQLPELLGEL